MPARWRRRRRRRLARAATAIEGQAASSARSAVNHATEHRVVDFSCGQWCFHAPPLPLHVRPIHEGGRLFRCATGHHGALSLRPIHAGLSSAPPRLVALPHEWLSLRQEVGQQNYALAATPARLLCLSQRLSGNWHGGILVLRHTPGSAAAAQAVAYWQRRTWPPTTSVTSHESVVYVSVHGSPEYSETIASVLAGGTPPRCFGATIYFTHPRIRRGTCHPHCHAAVSQIHLWARWSRGRCSRSVHGTVVALLSCEIYGHQGNQVLWRSQSLSARGSSDKQTCQRSCRAQSRTQCSQVLVAYACHSAGGSHSPRTTNGPILAAMGNRTQRRWYLERR
eukprot:COSAG01_NODE_4943_length_4605_cov_11.292943_5_plen_337_part_00